MPGGGVVSALADLRMLDRLAWSAAWSCWSRVLDPHERHDTAYSAILEVVAEHGAAGASATPVELVEAGIRAVEDDAHAVRSDRGLTAPRGHAVYWDDDRGEPDPGDTVPPRLALAEVMAALPDRHVEALLILAAYGDPQTAASAVGVSYGTFQRRVQVARRAAYELWFDGEVPPHPTFDRRTPTTLATHCGRGHEYTPDNTRWRKATSGRGRKRACRACDRIHEERRAA